MTNYYEPAASRTQSQFWWMETGMGMKMEMETAIEMEMEMKIVIEMDVLWMRVRLCGSLTFDGMWIGQLTSQAADNCQISKRANERPNTKGIKAKNYIYTYSGRTYRERTKQQHEPRTSRSWGLYSNCEHVEVALHEGCHHGSENMAESESIGFCFSNSIAIEEEKYLLRYKYDYDNIIKIFVRNLSLTYFSKSLG